MDAISSIRQMFTPASQALNNGGLNGAAPIRIPTDEIQKLSSGGVSTTAVSGTSQPDTFNRLLTGMVNEVNDKQTASKQAVNGLLTGENVSLQQAMISMEEASVSFQLMVEVRNKLLESYQELMRMQV